MGASYIKKEHSAIYPLHVFYWVIVIIGAIVLDFMDFKDNTFMEVVQMLKEYVSSNSIIDILAEFVFSLFISVFRMALTTPLWPVTFLYLAVTTGYTIYSVLRLDKVDFKSRKYYREILPNMSAAVLSYIDDFKISDKDIAATLLGLELKSKIKIGNEITVINVDAEDLCENEKYVFNLIKAKKLKEINLEEFKTNVVEDCLANKLIEERKQAKKSGVKYILFCIIIYILIILLYSFIGYIAVLINNHVVNLLAAMIIMILFFIRIFYPFVAVYTIFSYMAFNTIDPYVRTIIGKKINGRLEGLRKYIKEYSLLSKQNKASVVLWEEYLIYSVILGINDKIVSELTDKFIK